MIPPIVGDYTRGLLLGETDLGLMYSGYDTTTKELIAIIHAVDDEIPMNADVLRKTVEYLIDKNQKNIIRYRDVVQVEGGFTFIIIDYYCYGQLSDYINMYLSFPESLAKIIAMQYVEILESLASAHIPYNRLSLINTFIGSDGRINCFGLHPPHVLQTKCALLKYSPYLNSPESLELLNTPGTVNDVWCLGIVLVELLAGKIIDDLDYVTCLKDVMKGITFPLEMSYDCQDFIKSLRGHPWLQSVQDLRHETLSPFVQFLEEHTPYENHIWSPESFKPETVFVDVCPSMKLLSDEEVEDFEALNNFSIAYIVFEKLLKDIAVNDDLGDDEKEILTCLVEEITTSLRLSEIEVDMKPSAIKFDELDSTLQKQTWKIKSMQEQLNSYTERSQILVQEIEKIQDFLMQSRNGVELLASTLFGKLTPSRIKGERDGLLQYICLNKEDDKLDKKKDKSVSSKAWKMVWVILKNTFLLVFKSPNDAIVVDSLVFKQKQIEVIPESKYNKKFCFAIQGRVFAAPDDVTFKQWNLSMSTATSWFQGSF
ncbi:Mitogen-activated protein kinase kinase kinase [Entamoeba marina]